MTTAQPSEACDVALALAWGRRLPTVASAAVDPGYVKTKLASAGAPGDVASSADILAYCCTEADLASAPYWKDRAARSVPDLTLPLAASDSERSPTGAVSCHAMSDAIRERKYCNGSEEKNVSSSSRA